MSKTDTNSKLITFPNQVVVLQNTSILDTQLVIHATSTRYGGFSEGEFGTLNLGLSTGDNPDVVLRNREMFYDGLGIQSNQVFYLQQVHGNHVEVINQELVDSFMGKQIRRIPNTDAMITDLRGIPIVILTADCFPIFILDRVTPAIGLAHTGWRGTKLRIASETFKKMQITYGTKPENCLAWISAGIGVCCYQVGEDIRNEFIKDFGISTVEGDRLNLSEINRLQLTAKGFSHDSIFATSYCTYHDKELFYSYRRTGQESGRMGSIFMLK